MTPPTDRLILVLGSGPGIGVGVATFFASKGFNKVALLSRNAARLLEDAASVEKECGKAGDVVVKTYACDLADTKGLKEVLGKVEAELGVPEVVVHNASHLTKSALGEYPEEDVEMDLKISTISLYTVSNWAIPHLVSLASDSGRKPCLFVTSGGLYKTPFAPYFALSLSKAAQHNLTMSLAQANASKGVHCAAIVVHGLVKPDSEFFSPKMVASKFWELYEQGSDGEKEIWVTAPQEDEQSKNWTARKEGAKV